MTEEVFDPTLSAEEDSFTFAPRPQKLEGLRLGLVENTKINSAVILQKVADRLGAKYGMEMVHMDRKKSPSKSLSEDAIRTFQGGVDFVLAGIGD
jgi:hypothetical protein